MRYYPLPFLLLLLFVATSCETDILTGDDLNDSSDDVFTPDTNAPSNVNALEALDLVNAIRTAGCTCGNEVMPPAPALELHPTLQRVAEGHSADQASQQLMSHQGSDGSRVGERLTAAGYTWRNVGENVAWNQRSVEQVVNAWKNSPGHCRNLMQSTYVHMGFAVEDWYWTQVFAR